jgi:hypothetical protein
MGFGVNERIQTTQVRGSRMTAPTVTAAERQFTERALGYLRDHAIDPQVALDAGVREDPVELVFPNVDDRGGYVRRRPWPRPGETAKVLQPGGRSLGLWWPLGRPEPGAAAVLVCEGESDALAGVTALRDAPPASGFAGVAVCAIPGTSLARHLGEHLAPLAVQEAFLALDADEPGRMATEAAIDALRAAGIRPIPVELPDGQDLADMLAAIEPDQRGHRLANRLADADAAAAGAEADASSNGAGPQQADAGGPNGKPIQINNRPLPDITSESLQALSAANHTPRLFVRGGALARVRRDEHERPLIDILSEAALRGMLARATDFARVNQDGETQTPPPLEVVRDILALGSWGFPALDGVIEAPALRPDGTVIREIGYDPASRLIHLPAPGWSMPSVPDDPSSAQRAESLEVLQEAIVDFPFVDEASRANALALMLTPIVRPAIDGPVPLALVDATKAGTGKGLLLSLTSLIATGRPASMLPAPTREEEWNKTLLATLLEGATLIVVDEADELRSPALASALTAPTLKGRILGRSEVVQLPQRATWAAAGNNVRLGGDLPRRCYWIRLDAKTARPWGRRGFRHPDILGWATGRRGDLLAAGLVLARAWYAAGCPEADRPVLGSYGAWTRTIAGILATAGLSGFLGNLEQFYDQADEESAAWETFLSAWLDAFGSGDVTVADVLKQIEAGGPMRDALPDDLEQALGKSVPSFRSKLGRALGKRAGTRYGKRELRVERVEQDRSSIQSWRVSARRGAEVAEVGGAISRAGAHTHAHARTAAGDNTSATSAPLRETPEAGAGA